MAQIMVRLCYICIFNGPNYMFFIFINSKFGLLIWVGAPGEELDFQPTPPNIFAIIKASSVLISHLISARHTLASQRTPVGTMFLIKRC